MNRIRWYGPTIVLLIVALVVLQFGPALTQRLAYVRTNEELRLVRDALAQNGTLAEMSNAFRDVARVVEPSVVHVQVATRMRPGRRGMEQMPQFRWFFGPEGPGEEEAPQQDKGDDQNMEQYDVPRPTGAGSGWVYSKSGYIVTNNHVVTLADRTTIADEIKVRFNNGAEYTATVVGTDPRTDIAVIKVKGDSFQPAKLAEDHVEQGDIVFAFGSPFGYEFSMSQGIVSATSRQVGILQQGYEKFIQTDAAINRGNSGGPLTNIYGQVIGMNTVIASRTGDFNGLGFAIPVDQIKTVVDQIIDSGKVTRGYLGISIEDLDPQMARSFGFDGKGVLVREPMAGTPAAKAGIKGGDIITKVDDRPVANSQDLRFLVADKKPGTKVKLTFFRDGKQEEMTVEVAELPENKVASAGNGEEAPVAPEEKASELLRKIGFDAVATYTREYAEKFHASPVEGVIVERVRRSSVAAAREIRPRDIITHVFNEPVATVEQFTAAIAKAGKDHPEDPVRLRVLRLNPTDGAYMARFVLIDVPKD